jgi:hypothetical protein
MRIEFENGSVVECLDTKNIVRSSSSKNIYIVATCYNCKCVGCNKYGYVFSPCEKYIPEYK